MKRKHGILSAAAVCACLAAGGQAQAMTIADWGHLGAGAAGGFGQTVHNTGDTALWFNHDYHFTPHQSEFQGMLQSLGDFASLHLKLFVGRWASEDGMVAAAGSVQPALLTWQNVDYAALVPGESYVLRVAGLVAAGGAATYSGGYQLGDHHISPVPLPGAAVLFGSAVLGLIAVGRQRRPNRAVASAQA